MAAYYNENDQHAAEWLQNLINAGLIAPGVVDSRDIREVQASDLEGHEQCHFFAGIGLWSLALRWAGVPDDAEFWTGSCPCQPYSAAGKRKGDADERNLWPAWLPLIRERRPRRIAGEQVASAIGHGWLDGVFAAHSVGEANVRQRLWWMGDASGSRRTLAREATELSSHSSWLVHTADGGCKGRFAAGRWSNGPVPPSQDYILCRDGKTRRLEPGLEPLVDGHSFRLVDGRSRSDCSRAAILKAIGNAIHPGVAAEFLKAVLAAQ